MINNEDMTESHEDEIDLKKIFQKLRVNRNTLIRITAVSLLFGGLIAFTQRRLWEGQFQIVLNLKNQSASSIQSLPMSANIQSVLGLGGIGSSGLQTEIGILKSPSLLMSIYNEVKAKKLALGEKVDDWTYAEWLKEYLTIELERDTTILNLAYRDHDKSLILPVLNKISKKYQVYSGRDRRRNINQGIDYLIKEIKKYETIANESLKVVQNFAVENDLSDFTGVNPRIFKSSSISNSETTEPSLETLDTEALRLASANTIRNIDEQLDQLSKINDSDQILSSGSSMFSSIAGASDLSIKLDTLNQNLSVLKTKFKKNDPLIIEYELRRDILTKLLKNQIIGFLNAKKSKALSSLKAYERDKSVLVKYRELLRNAFRDEQTLIKLNDELRLLNLDKSRISNPWELITQPTLLDNPVAPHKTRIMGLSLLLGLIISSSYILITKK